MRSLLLTYLVFIPLITVQRVIVLIGKPNIDFVIELGIVLKWSIGLAVFFFVWDLIASYSISDRRLELKKSGIALPFALLLSILAGLMIPRIDIVAIISLVIILIASDYFRGLMLRRYSSTKLN